MILDPVRQSLVKQSMDCRHHQKTGVPLLHHCSIFTSINTDNKYSNITLILIPIWHTWEIKYLCKASPFGLTLPCMKIFSSSLEFVLNLKKIACVINIITNFDMKTIIDNREWDLRMIRYESLKDIERHKEKLIKGFWNTNFLCWLVVHYFKNSTIFVYMRFAKFFHFTVFP